MDDMRKRLLDIINEHISVTKNLGEEVLADALAIAEWIVATIKKGGKIYWCGNGGSAADCQHLSTELCFRFKQTNHVGIPSIALTTDTSILTAVGNDIEFSEIFAVQVRSLMNREDMLIGISTSGKSGNVRYAMDDAKRKGCFVVAITGQNGFIIPKERMNINLRIPSTDTARIQEIYMMLGHAICEIVEERISEWRD